MRWQASLQHGVALQPIVLVAKLGRLGERLGEGLPRPLVDARAVGPHLAVAVVTFDAAVDGSESQAAVEEAVSSTSRARRRFRSFMVTA
jgi:hypothetical protein